MIDISYEEELCLSFNNRKMPASFIQDLVITDDVTRCMPFQKHQVKILEDYTTTAWHV